MIKSKHQRMIGVYLCFYAVAWALQVVMPNSGPPYISTLLVVSVLFFTCLFVGIFRQHISSSVVRFISATFAAGALSWLICVATLFNPLGVRPSPIPLSEQALSFLNGSFYLFIGITGLVISFKRHRFLGPKLNHDSLE
jgi:hypothetical protein